MKYVMAIAAAASFMLGFALPLPQSNTSSLSVSPTYVATYVLEISSSGGEPLVVVHTDGTVEYGKDYTPDKAARQFWEAMGRFAPCSEKKEDKNDKDR